jgi:hypothetical protein
MPQAYDLTPFLRPARRSLRARVPIGSARCWIWHDRDAIHRHFASDVLRSCHVDDTTLDSYRFPGQRVDHAISADAVSGAVE